MRAMGVAVLSYPTIAADTLLSLRRASERLGVELVEVPAHEVSVLLDPSVSVEPLGTDDADVILHRTIQPYRDLVVPVLMMLRARGRVVLNDPTAALISRNKLHTLALLADAGLPIVPTQAVAHAEVALRLAGPPEQVVLKPALGTSGLGVRRCRAADLAEHLTPYDPELGPTLVQPLIVTPFDLRAFVVDGRCVGLAQRHAGGDEWRCNVTQGATMRPVADRAVAERAADLAISAVAALGLDYAAVDLLPDGDELLLSEVDAWGGYAALERSLGVDVSGAILDLARTRWKG